MFRSELSIWLGASVSLLPVIYLDNSSLGAGGSGLPSIVY